MPQAGAWVRKAKFICVAVLLALLTACASGPLPRPQPPSVTLASLQLVSLGLAQQTLRLNLNLANSNAFMLPLRGMNYQLKLNGQPFISGVSNDQINIPAGGSSAISLDVSANLLAWLTDPKYAALLTGDKVDYELAGSIGLLSQGLALPFSRAGSVVLSR